MTTAACLLIAATALGLRWLHLAWILAGRRRSTEPRKRGGAEWQVMVLAASYVAALLVWGLSTPRAWMHAATAATTTSTAMVVAGAVLRVWGQGALGRGFDWSADVHSGRLVTHGPYRVFKHPLLIGYALECGGLLVGAFGFLWGRLVIAAALAAALAGQIVREERALRRAFGDEWKRFSRGKIL